MALRWKPEEIPGKWAAQVVCVCGGYGIQVNDQVPVQCNKCGAWLRLVENSDGTITPKGEAPDGYKFDKRRKLHVLTIGRTR